MVYLISSSCNLGFLDTVSEISFPSSAPPLKSSSMTPETSRWARNSYLSLSLWTVYRSLKDLLGDGEDCVGTFVKVTVLEIYNEEIYDVLSSYGGGCGEFGFRWPRGNGSNSKITDLPFSLYSTFVVEARHSFNKQMIWLFFQRYVERNLPYGYSWSANCVCNYYDCADPYTSTVWGIYSSKKFEQFVLKFWV